VNGAPGSSVLQVSPGTGVSLGGTAVHLDAPATLDLMQVLPAGELTGSMFADCRPPSSSTKAPNAGAYLLTMAPTSTFHGKVPVQGSPNATLPTPCTSRWEVEGVVFSAIRLDGFASTATTPSNRQNLLAHWCFGSALLEPLAMSGFTAPVPHSPLAELADLTPCDLLLAVFDWDGAALAFVDEWSARRRPVRPPATTYLADVVSDERTADGEARFLQFQEQLATMLGTPAGGGGTRATDVFPQLPPAGLIPYDPVSAAGRVGGARAVAHEQAPERPVSAVKDLAPFRAVLERRSRLVGATNTGALSAQLTNVLERVDELQQQVEALTARLGGKHQGAAAGRAAAEQLADDVFDLLLDTAAGGFDLATFFDGVSIRVGVVDHETVDFTIRRSWCDEPLPAAQATLGVFFVMSSDQQTLAPYVLFAKRQRGIRWIDFSTERFDR
jgi:hypothetical protein